MWGRLFHLTLLGALVWQSQAYSRNRRSISEPTIISHVHRERGDTTPESIFVDSLLDSDLPVFSTEREGSNKMDKLKDKILSTGSRQSSVSALEESTVIKDKEPTENGEDPAPVNEVGEVAEVAAEDAAIDAAVEYAREVAEDVAEDVAEEAAQDAARETARETAEQVAEQVANAVAQQTAAETAEQIAQQIGGQEAGDLAEVVDDALDYMEINAIEDVQDQAIAGEETNSDDAEANVDEIAVEVAQGIDGDDGDSGLDEATKAYINQMVTDTVKETVQSTLEDLNIVPETDTFDFEDLNNLEEELEEKMEYTGVVDDAGEYAGDEGAGDEGDSNEEDIEGGSDEQVEEDLVAIDFTFENEADRWGCNEIFAKKLEGIPEGAEECIESSDEWCSLDKAIEVCQKLETCSGVTRTTSHYVRRGADLIDAPDEASWLKSDKCSPGPIELPEGELPCSDDNGKLIFGTEEERSCTNLISNLFFACEITLEEIDEIHPDYNFPFQRVDSGIDRSTQFQYWCCETCREIISGGETEYGGKDTDSASEQAEENEQILEEEEKEERQEPEEEEAEEDAPKPSYGPEMHQLWSDIRAWGW